MRYFTRERLGLADGNADESLDWERDVLGAYRAHIETIRSRLPHDLRLLACREAYLHDAQFDLVELHPRLFRLRLLTSGALHAPLLLELRYTDHELVGGRDLSDAVESLRPYIADYDAPPPQPVAGYTQLGMIIADEVDIVDDRFQHSFVVDPLGDFTVRFAGFSLDAQPADLPLPRDMPNPPRANFLPARPQRFLEFDD